MSQQSQQEPTISQPTTEQRRLEAVLDTQIARITNRNAPIYSLPNEIITAIFNAGIPTSKKFPILVSHITHHLREVALSSPSLWKRIHISSPRSFDRVDAYVHRSKCCLLEIAVYAAKGRFKFNLPQSLLSHITRWRYFQIISPHRSHTGFREVLEQLSGVSAPHLEQMCIQTHLFSPQFSGGVPHLFAGGAPVLSKVTLRGIPISPNLLPLMAITSLEIMQHSFLNYRQLCQFLLAAPLLMDLTIWQQTTMWGDRSFDNTCMNASLPSLLSLTIHIPYNNIGCLSGCLHGVCIMLRMPVLRHLKLDSTPRHDLHPFAALCSRDSPYPALKTLEISGISAEALRDLSHGLPSVTNITICLKPYNEDGDDDPYDGVRNDEIDEDNRIILKILCDDKAWPHLDTLTILSFDETDEELMSALCHMIASRPSIHHLCLQTFSGMLYPETSPGTGVGETQYGLAWLRAHVELSYLKL